MNNLIIAKNYETFGEEGLTSNKVIYYKDDNIVKFRANITDNPYGESEVVTINGSQQDFSYNFLKNTASTKIDTGISANNNTRLEYKLWSNRTDSFYALGTRQTSSGSHLFSLTGSSNSHNINVGVGTAYSAVPDLVRVSGGYTYEGWIQTNGDMTFSWYLKDIGTNTEYSNNNVDYSVSLANNDKHIFLFSNGFQNLPPTIRFYYVKIYQNGVLVRDFRPAKVNNVSGLYDFCSKQMFTAPNIALE